jgi:hypothetical protein
MGKIVSHLPMRQEGPRLEVGIKEEGGPPHQAQDML